MEVEVKGEVAYSVHIEFKECAPGKVHDIHDIKEGKRLRWSVQMDGAVTPDVNEVSSLISSQKHHLRTAWKGFDIYGRDGRDYGKLSPVAEVAYLAFMEALRKAKWTA